jgi:hypothetical protein
MWSSGAASRKLCLTLTSDRSQCVLRDQIAGVTDWHATWQQQLLFGARTRLGRHEMHTDFDRKCSAGKHNPKTKTQMEQ